MEGATGVGSQPTAEQQKTPRRAGFAALPIASLYLAHREDAPRPSAGVASNPLGPSWRGKP
jgi:hypothetical protein